MAGRITLNRPEALNALTHQMCLDIETALNSWAEDPDVALVLIDAAGDRAFCAGGDIAKMYATGTAGDFSYGRRFWQDEYRLNALIARFEKPIISFLHGFTMGGGVGLGCHAAHRVVCESSQIAMPEVSIGLVPDVGGSLLLARAPGRLGEYFGLTAARMSAATAITAGFADHYVPFEDWDGLKRVLIDAGDMAALDTFAKPPGSVEIEVITECFAAPKLTDIAAKLAQSATSAAKDALKRMERHSPLAMAGALAIIRGQREGGDIATALRQEYRFTARSMEHGDFLEGIRAQIIDKDKSPRWRHSMDTLPEEAVERMLAPLGDEELKLEDGV